MCTDVKLNLDELVLFDHHCHGVVNEDLDRAGFEELISESSAPAVAGTTRFDSQVGFAIRRFCSAPLGISDFSEPDEYLRVRQELGSSKVNRILLEASKISYLGIETGHQPKSILSPEEMSEVASAKAYEIVRLEKVAETVAFQHLDVGGNPFELWSKIVAELDKSLCRAIGVKTIAAYRVGLDFPYSQPTDDEAVLAVANWFKTLEPGQVPRLADPEVIRALIWYAIKKETAIQFHIGYGDDDVDLHRCNPLLLTNLIRAAADYDARFMLLHCYPFHREAGYLADVFPSVYFDVGLAINYTGSRSASVIAESLELAPFGKILFSSDAFGLPELYYIGAKLFRDGLARVLQSFIDEHQWPLAEAERVASMIGFENAIRAYKLEG